LSTKLAENNPRTWGFVALISRNLRELDPFVATHNPKVAGSNPAPVIQPRVEVRSATAGEPIDRLKARNTVVEPLEEDQDVTLHRQSTYPNAARTRVRRTCTRGV
jgi:hypothetical protein